MNWKVVRFMLFAIIFALCLTISVPLHAQSTGATLLGTITDPSGSAVPNAKVSIRNLGTNVSTDTTSNADGAYSVPNLIPGEYEVSASAAGFSTAVSKVTLSVGQQQQLGIALAVGQVTQTVEVTGAAPAVELTSSTISAQVSETTVRELPLNGRDWTQLATLQPGIFAAKNQVGTNSGQGRNNRGWGNQLIAAGHRSPENNYRMNGVSINDFTNSAPGNVLASNPGVDAIQEFSVLSTNYSAEYGKTSGVIINAISRSGTNQIHGSAYEFLRNSALDARNFFDGAQIPEFRRNQFGAAAGGPIIKNKMFVFGAYEGVRQAKAITYAKVLVPTDALRNGILCSTPPPPVAPATQSVCSTFVIPGGVNQYIKPYLAFWPDASHLGPGSSLAPIPLGNGDAQYLNSAASTITPDNYYTIRGDYTVSSKDNIAVTFFRDNSLLQQPNLLVTAISSQGSNRYMGSIEENHVFSSTLTNTARLGFSSTRGLASPIAAINPNTADTSFGVVPGYQAPALTISGAPIVGCCNTLGRTDYQTIQVGDSLQIYDDVFVSRGNHALKFGVSLERQMAGEGNGLPGGGGSESFNTSGVTGTTIPAGVSAGEKALYNFLTDNPKTAVGPFNVITDPRIGRGQIRDTQMLYGLYVQDDWRFRPNLTFNIGVRYEPFGLITERHNAFYNVQAPQNGDLPANVYSFLGNQNSSLAGDFEPRVGFAWDPFKNGKTAIRGGFGIFDVAKLAYQFNHNLISAYPFKLNSTLTTTNVTLSNGTIVALQNNVPIKTNVDSASQLDPSSKATTMSVQPNGPVNYDMNWNLNIQHQFTSNLTATVGYVGSRGIHQSMLSSDGNVKLPSELTPDGYLWPCGTLVTPPPPAPPHCTTVGNGTYFDKNITGGMAYLIWNGNSSYHGLQAAIIQRMSHGFQIQGSYTFGKCIDLNNAGYTSNPFNNDIQDPLTYYAQSVARGPCAFDVRHTFVSNYIWMAPTPKFAGAIGEHVLGGWQLGGVVTLTTGAPETAYITGDSLGTAAVNESSANNYNFPDILPNCNPVTGNPDAYFNLACFTPPTSAALTAAGKCMPANAAVAVANTCMNLLGNLGRNHLAGPNLINFDFSLFKNIPLHKISEVSSLQFRSEFFNVFNRANFNGPAWIDRSAGIYNADGTAMNGGNVITSTSTTSRQIEFGLKLSW